MLVEMLDYTGWHLCSYFYYRCVSVVLLSISALDTPYITGAAVNVFFFNSAACNYSLSDMAQA